MAILSQDNHDRISASIRTAEAETSGEIVCVLAGSSDSYFYPAAFTVGAGMLLASLGAALLVDLWWLSIPLWHFVLAQLAASAAVLALLAAFPRLRMLFVPRYLRYRRAHRNAVAQFLSRNIHVTRERTGVLIFVSLAERYAEVVTDAGINARVPQSAWDAIVAKLTAEAAAGRLTEGFEGAIAAAGELLAREFPRREDDPAELPDRLVEI